MVFMAAALECGSMLPGRRYGQGGAGIDRLLLLNNRQDPALKRYGIIDPQRRPEALGYRGIACPQRLAGCADQRDVSRLVGRTHDLEPYLANCGLMRAAWQTLAVDCGSTIVASLE